MIVDIVIIVVLAVLVFYLVACPVIAWISVTVFFPRRMKKLTREPDFRVNVIVPCHGTSEAFAENVLAIVRQQYPRYVVTFVTDTAEDRAMPGIRAAMKAAPHARHIVAGRSERTAGKINAELVAIKADTENDVFVICDSDLRPEPGWLREMVRPFVDPAVRVTGSSRWIGPSRIGLGRLTYTGLGGYYPVMMSLPFFSLIWGGCFAITRKAFIELDVERIWTNSETDDLNLSSELGRRGDRPVFVPTAVSTSHEVHDTAASLVRWFTYNLQTGRIHTFWPWLLLLIMETLITAGFLASLAVLVVQGVRGWFDIHALLAPAYVLLMGLNGLLIKLPYRKKKDMALVWWFLVPLLGHFVIVVAIWRSAFLRKMRLGREQIVEFNRDGSIKRILRKSSPTG